MHAGSLKSSAKRADVNGIHGPAYKYLSIGIIDWRADIEKCLTWEANSRIENGMCTKFLDMAAKELGCTICI